MNMDTDATRFRELAFLFACDKLDAEQTAWMYAMLAQNPAWQADIDAERAWVDQARSGLAARRDEAPPLVSLETVLAASSARDRSAPSALLAWASRWWHARLPLPWAIGAAGLAAAAAAFVLPQAGYRDDQAPLYRGAEQGRVSGPLLKVVFDDRISLKELRGVLAAQRLTVVRGPDPQGIVWLKPADGDAARALAALRANAAVLDAQIVGGAP